MALLPLVASRLRELRNRHNLTQEEAAELVGVSMRFYQTLESGRKKQVWLETIERLAAPFNLEAWQMIGPELPADTKVRKLAGSRIHYRPRHHPPIKRRK